MIVVSLAPVLLSNKVLETPNEPRFTHALQVHVLRLPADPGARLRKLLSPELNRSERSIS
jgi:hypothetical protein